jgi:hypothetical protein
LLPDDPHLRYHVGAALLRSGQAAAALPHLERAVVDGADYHGLDHAKELLAAARTVPATAPAPGSAS